MTRNLWHHLVRSLFVPKSARVSSSLRSGKHTLKNRFRPTFERLDDRVVPAVITVNTLADTDDGASLGATISLRDAINDCTPGDTVQFDSSLDGGAIKLSSNLGSLNINHDLTIDGITGLSKGITVDGGNAVRDFFVRPDFVHSTSATASISGLTIKNGHGNGGGGVYVNDAGLTISNCTIIANSADSSGGGIFADEINARVTAIDCTITKNTAVAGGGVSINDSFYGCNFTAINCTISGNSSTRDGGGIDVSGPAFLKNTLVAGNSAPSGPDIDGDPIANYCLIQNTTNCILEDGSGNNITDVDHVLLAPLGNYGGPTQTMALLPGSPAIDAGSNALVPSGVTTDQRGLSRVGNVDIGAFESQGFTVTPFSGDKQAAPLNTAFNKPLVVKVTANNPLEPVAGGIVSFGALTSATGASASFTGSPATIDASGYASVMATANGSAGTYSVTASTTEGTTATFTLTNGLSLTDVIAYVQSLSNLNHGQQNALTSTLNAAIDALNRGDNKAALNQLDAFENKVNAFVKTGILTQDQADLLLSSEDAIEIAIG